LLARKDIATVLILGAGTVGRNLVAAYRALFGDLRFLVWNRTPSRAEAMAEELGLNTAPDLHAAVAEADVICGATMATDPVLPGAWLRPGQHLDLIGAYRPDMRETDDAALRRARIFVDSRETTLHHIGELKIPLETGVIEASDVAGDLYDLVAGRAGRQSEQDITLFKNGGGAHLDLMTSKHILAEWRRAHSL
ncbi:MAG: ornithine cyclodeaminase, partial [Pseudomonadota bacterium]